jgi:hypothetical protein
MDSEEGRNDSLLVNNPSSSTAMSVKENEIQVIRVREDEGVHFISQSPVIVGHPLKVNNILPLLKSLQGIIIIIFNKL